MCACDCVCVVLSAVLFSGQVQNTIIPTAVMYRMAWLLYLSEDEVGQWCLSNDGKSTAF